MKKGLFLGKFMPFHLGHKFTADFALNYVDELTILICSTDYEPISGKLRSEIIQKIYVENPKVRIVHHHENLPQYPEEDKNFWNIWKNVIEQYGDFGTVFSSEPYGFEVAKIINAKHIMVDQGRNIFPISGTATRENTIKNWYLLPAETQEAFAKRFCIVGPESTGKTTLTTKLAKDYKGIFLPEYGRIYYENKVLENPKYVYECKYPEILEIGKGHFLYEEYAKTHPLLFADTDAIITKIFSEIYFGKSPDLIEEYIKIRSNYYDLYLVTKPNVPWVSDGQRDLEHARNTFYEKLITYLEKYNRNYKIIDAEGWQDRELQAKTIVNQYVKNYA